MDSRSRPALFLMQPTNIQGGEFDVHPTLSSKDISKTWRKRKSLMVNKNVDKTTCRQRQKDPNPTSPASTCPTRRQRNENHGIDTQSRIYGVAGVQGKAVKMGRGIREADHIQNEPPIKGSHIWSSFSRRAAQAPPRLPRQTHSSGPSESTQNTRRI